jgi:signal transduction histidine kinase/FixJ family two-component response regulator
MSNERGHIIIIDDEPAMGESFATLLRDDGYHVTSFSRSADGIAFLRDHRVDLVVSDIKMPQYDGLDVLRAVKEHDDGIPVILMTGYASLETAIDAIGQGAYDYLLKPVNYTQLLLAVRRALDKRRSELARLHLLEELKLNNLLLNRRVGELNALYEAGKSIGSLANLQDLLRQIIALAASVTDAQTGSVMLFDERREFLHIAASIGLAPNIVAETRLAKGESIAGHVANTAEPIVIENLESDARFGRSNRERYASRSLLCAPLRIKNEVLGVINLADKHGGVPFGSDDLRLLVTFAAQAAVAVDDAHQFEKSRRRLVEFEILNELSTALPTLKSFDMFRELLAQKLSRVFPIDYSIWFSWNATDGRLVPDGATGITLLPMTESGKIDLRKISIDKLNIPPATVESLDFDDLHTFTRVCRDQLEISPKLIQLGRAFMAIPVLRNSELVYVLTLGSSQDRAYTEEDMSLARLVVSQAALLFEKERALLNATRLMTMGNMISEISHDLRKPLTSISGGLQLLKQRHPDICEGSEFFLTAESEVHRMNELVRELVDFSNPNKYETSRVDIRHLITKASELVTPEMTKHHVSFSSRYDDLDWQIIANRNQVLEMFLNLFINAIDAMPNGGSLSVVGISERPEHKKDEYLAVRVIDTGVGIPKEKLPRIFDRYYTTKVTGTGLGLVVVERIISAHGGTLSVKSSLGEGTTFTVYFPTSV